MEKKPALWARIIGALVAGAADNFWLLFAAGWLIYGDTAMCLISIMLAFYHRLTQIRDRISMPEFTLTINKGAEPNPVFDEKPL